jgi:DNA-binding transcriptional LysR family regulator
LNKNALSVLKKIELTSNEAVKQAILSDLGYSIMPLIGIKNELQNQQLEIIPQEDLPIITHWQLIWLKDKKHSPVAQRFLEFIEKEKEAIIANQFDWYEKY